MAQRHVAVLGLGSFGGSVARELTRLGERVLGMDTDEEATRRISDEIRTAVIANAMDKRALEDAGLDQYEAVIISMGDDVEASMIAALHVLEIGCPTVWVKARSEAHSEILKAIGVKPDHIVLPEQRFGEHVAQRVHNPAFIDYLSIKGGKFLGQLLITDRLSGKALEALDLAKTHGLGMAGMIRDGALIDMKAPGQTLRAGDTLLLYGSREALRKYADDACR